MSHISPPSSPGSRLGVRLRTVLAGLVVAALAGRGVVLGPLAMVDAGEQRAPRLAWRHRLAVRRSLPAIVAAVLVLASCRLGPGADHYAAVLDGLRIPAGWELAHTTVMVPGGPDRRVDPSRPRDDIDCFEGECPSVTRYYFVSGTPATAYPDARQLLVDAGFDIDQESGPACNVPPSGPVCGMSGSRGGDYVRVSLYNPGDDINAAFISDPLRTLIEFVARVNSN
jgi:hypothetical protein